MAFSSSELLNLGGCILASIFPFRKERGSKGTPNFRVSSSSQSRVQAVRSIGEFVHRKSKVWEALKWEWLITEAYNCVFETTISGIAAGCIWHTQSLNFLARGDFNAIQMLCLYVENSASLATKWHAVCMGRSVNWRTFLKKGLRCCRRDTRVISSWRASW